MKLNVLVVEDSPEYQEIISRTLGDYNLTKCFSAEEAAQQIRNHSFELILIDINLPAKDGFGLVAEIRANPELANAQILCLTGRSAITDKITAFSLGADDYLTKPFDPLELRARVDSKLKKVATTKSQNTILVVGDIEIDLNRHRVISVVGGKKAEVDLTQTEFKLLSCLSRRPEQVFTRDQLLVAAWGEDAKVLDRVVDVHVCSLRKKLGSCGNYIKSVSGIGYKLIPRGAKSSDKAS